MTASTLVGARAELRRRSIRRLGRRAQRRRRPSRAPSMRCAATARGGGRVVLITNAPRAAAPDHRRCSIDMGVPRDAYDGARLVRRRHARHDRALSRQGRPSHRPAHRRRHRSTRASASSAAAPRTPRPSSSPISTPTTTRRTCIDDRIKLWLKRKLPLICANPDRVVEHGGRHHLLRRRAGRSLRSAWRPHPDGRQALSADLRRRR